MLEKDKILAKIKTLIKSGQIENLKLAFEIAKRKNISELDILHPWIELISFLKKGNVLKKENHLNQLLEILECNGPLNNPTRLQIKKCNLGL